MINFWIVNKISQKLISNSKLKFHCGLLSVFPKAKNQKEGSQSKAQQCFRSTTRWVHSLTHSRFFSMTQHSVWSLRKCPWKGEEINLKILFRVCKSSRTYYFKTQNSFINSFFFPDILSWIKPAFGGQSLSCMHVFPLFLLIYCFYFRGRHFKKEKEKKNYSSFFSKENLEKISYVSW